ncbi:MAG: hypothetical protein WDN28_25165 [Chthoniobacter sp.]
MSGLDARLLAALRASQVHLFATDLASPARHAAGHRRGPAHGTAPCRF